MHQPFVPFFYRQVILPHLDVSLCLYLPSLLMDICVEDLATFCAALVIINMKQLENKSFELDYGQFGIQIDKKTMLGANEDERK